MKILIRLLTLVTIINFVLILPKAMADKWYEGLESITLVKPIPHFHNLNQNIVGQESTQIDGYQLIKRKGVYRRASSPDDMDGDLTDPNSIYGVPDEPLVTGVSFCVIGAPMGDHIQKPAANNEIIMYSSPVPRPSPAPQATPVPYHSPAPNQSPASGGP